MTRALPIAAACVLAATFLSATPMPASAAGAPPPPPGWKPGWLQPRSAWIGRYHLVSARSGKGGKRLAETGALTLFMQTAYPGKPAVPSGILSLHRRKSRHQSAGTIVLYLTELDHHGKQLESLVHGGAFVAPASGRFTPSSLASGTLSGSLTVRGLATQRLSFRRFSKNPQP